MYHLIQFIRGISIWLFSKVFAFVKNLLAKTNVWDLPKWEDTVLLRNCLIPKGKSKIVLWLHQCSPKIRIILMFYMIIIGSEDTLFSEVNFILVGWRKSWIHFHPWNWRWPNWIWERENFIHFWGHGAVHDLEAGRAHATLMIGNQLTNLNKISCLDYKSWISFFSFSYSWTW